MPLLRTHGQRPPEAVRTLSRVSHEVRAIGRCEVGDGMRDQYPSGDHQAADQVFRLFTPRIPAARVPLRSPRPPGKGPVADLSVTSARRPPRTPLGTSLTQHPLHRARTHFAKKCSGGVFASVPISPFKVTAFQTIPRHSAARDGRPWPTRTPGALANEGSGKQLADANRLRSNLPRAGTGTTKVQRVRSTYPGTPIDNPTRQRTCTSSTSRNPARHHRSSRHSDSSWCPAIGR